MKEWDSFLGNRWIWKIASTNLKSKNSLKFWIIVYRNLVKDTEFEKLHEEIKNQEKLIEEIDAKIQNLNEDFTRVVDLLIKVQGNNEDLTT